MSLYWPEPARLEWQLPEESDMEKIVIGDKKPENAEAIANSMNAAGFDTVSMEIDLSSRESVLTLIAEGKRYGEIAMLVNAGMYLPASPAAGWSNWELRLMNCWLQYQRKNF